MKRPAWDFSPLFTPRSIAVVGASPRGGAGSIVLQNMQRMGFTGQIYPVNPRYSEVFDLPCYASLEDLPSAPDSVALLLNDKAILPMLHQVHAVGGKAAWAFASGFAEVGEEGRIMQQRIREFCHESGLLFCGPNCVGYANIIDSACMFSAPLPHAFRKGSIGVIAQSGAILLALGNSSRNPGFSHLISSGNEASLGLADYMDFLIDDPATKVITLFLEAIRDPEAVANACARAKQHGKAVIALKVGRSEIACRVAVTHTGAIAGNDKMLEAFFRRHGIIRVHTLDELLETAILFSSLAPCPITSRRICMSTVSGGEMGMLADISSDYGLEFPQLAEESITALQKVLPPYSPLANPLDAWGSGDLSEAYPASLSILAHDPGAELLVVSQDMPSNMADIQVDQFAKVAHAAVRARKQSGKPVVVVSNISGGIDATLSQILEEGGVPVLQGSTAGLGAIAAWLDWNSMAQTSKAVSFPPAPALPKNLQAELDTCSGVVPYALAIQLLAHVGICDVQEEVVHSMDEALQAAQKLGYPVTLKGLSPDIAHKTEAGLVLLNILDEAALRSAWANIDKAFAREKYAIREGVLVQSMVQEAAVESIVGVHRDPVFGPAVLVGLGGIFVELLRDVAMELAPLRSEEALQMVNALQAKELFYGFRGAPAADVASLCDVLLRVGQLAELLGERLISLDLNPVFVLAQGKGVRIVDVVMQVSDARNNANA